MATNHPADPDRSPAVTHRDLVGRPVALVAGTVRRVPVAAVAVAVAVTAVLTVLAQQVQTAQGSEVWPPQS